jgi:gas vesicle protein
MTDHRKDSGSGDETRFGREQSGSSGSEGGPRQHRSTRHHGRRKERVLHTRISEQLSEDIRQLADDLRLPVSNLVRNVLEEVFTVVENVSDDVGDFFEDVVEEADGIRERIRKQQEAACESSREERKQRRRGRRAAPNGRGEDGPQQPPEPPSGASQDDVLGWQPILLNQPQQCGRCNHTLGAGDNAMMGVSATGARSQIVCPGCAAEN